MSNSFNVIYIYSCCENITGGVNIYFYVCLSLLVPVCVLCVLLLCMYDQSTSKPRVIHVNASVNFTP